MLYFGVDNNLSSAGYKELARLKGLGKNPKVKTVILMDNASFDTAPTPKIYELKEGEVKLLKKLPEASLADLNFFSSFISFVKENYSAEKYFLIFFGHGNGWYPSSNFKKALLYDATSSDWLSVAGGGLKNFVKEARTILGKKIEIVGFDACLLGMIEVAFEIIDDCKIMLASSSVVPVVSWDYYNLIKTLEENPSCAPYQLAETWADLNIKYITAEANFTALDLEEMRKVYKEDFRRLFSLLEKPGGVQHLQEARRMVQTFPFMGLPSPSDAHIDLIHLFQLLNLESELKKSVIALKNTNLYRNALGIASFFPKNYLTFKRNVNDYLLLDFEKEVNWLSFLNDFYSQDDIKPTKVDFHFCQREKTNDVKLAWQKSFDLAEVKYSLFLVKGLLPVFYDNCESFLNWEVNGFFLSNRYYLSGTNSFFSNEGLNLDNHLVLKEPLNIPFGALLSFYALYHTEEDLFNEEIKRDKFYIEYSFDKENYLKLDSFYGQSGFWEAWRVYLPPGESVWLRFRYKTDGSGVNLGVFIDEISVLRFSFLKIYSSLSDTFYQFFNLFKERYYFMVMPIDKFGNKGQISLIEKLEIDTYGKPIALPNPFLKGTRIYCDIPKDFLGEGFIYDVAARRYAHFYLKAQEFELDFFKKKPSGVYFLLLKGKDYKRVGKLVKIFSQSQ